MSDLIQIVTTTGSKEDASRIATTLVDRHLAACVQIGGPIESVYRWQGKVERSTEWVCVVKTRRELYALVETAIQQLHPYEVPEILALPVVAASRSYQEWLEGQVRLV